MSLKKINEKLNEKQRKIIHSTNKLMMNNDGPLFCDKCNNRLGIIRMLRQSIFKKKGSNYLVTCKNCYTINIRVKGDIGENIDREWREYGV